MASPADSAAAPPSLPPPREPGCYRIGLVCLGNICRSPMGEVVLRSRLAAAGLDDAVEVSSTGTGDWHLGEPMDRRAAATLAGRGYDPSRHRARQFDASWFAAQDLVLVMDRANLDEVSSLVGAALEPERLQWFRAFDPDGGQTLDVPDPWQGGQSGFDDVLAIVERTSDTLVAALRTAAVDQPR